MSKNPRHSVPAASDPPSTAITPANSYSRFNTAVARTAIPFAVWSILLVIVCRPAISQVRQQRPVLDDRRIIQRIDAAVRAREDAIAGYTVNDRYAIYINQEPNPRAVKTVQVVYRQESGKTITPSPRVALLCCFP
jgi:hypothetical protein